MPHPITGYTAFELKGKSYLLALRNEELCDIQAAMGIPFGPEHDAPFLKRFGATATVSGEADLEFVFSVGACNRSPFSKALSGQPIEAGQTLVDELSPATAREILAVATRWLFPEPVKSDTAGGEPWTWTRFLSIAMQCEIGPAEFWASTLRGVVLAIEAFNVRTTERRRVGTTLAYQNAAWSQMGKKMPRLASVLPGASRSRNADRAARVAEQKAFLQEMATQFGGVYIEGGKA